MVWEVQRPDMVRSVALDLYVLRKYCQVVEAVKEAMMRVGILAQRRQFDVELIDTFAAASWQEMHY